MTTLCFAFFFFFPKPIVTKQPPHKQRGAGPGRAQGAGVGVATWGTPDQGL